MITCESGRELPEFSEDGEGGGHGEGPEAEGGVAEAAMISPLVVRLLLVLSVI